MVSKLASKCENSDGTDDLKSLRQQIMACKLDSYKSEY